MNSEEKTEEIEITKFCFEQWGVKDLPAIGLKICEEAGEFALLSPRFQKVD